MRTQVFSLLVENHVGVLTRIAGLFSRRGYSIDSISTGVTSDPRFARLTIASTGDEAVLEQIEKQVSKLEDVVSIKLLVPEESVTRELVLIKIKATPENRQEIVSTCSIFRANIIDVQKDSIIIELTGGKNKVNAFLDIVKGYDILELARTGLSGLSRGSSDVKIID